MSQKKNYIPFGVFSIIVLFLVPIIIFLPSSPAEPRDPWEQITKARSHLDHTSFFTSDFKEGPEVTKACLECHPNAAKKFMKTSHWQWQGHEVKIPGREEPLKIGKKNLLNNFCLGIRGNWASCTSCHAGYGWGDASFDFEKEENVDCLICHDWTGNYVKGGKGLPVKGVNLKEVAQKVGYPKRENCGICHIYGGGGMGVKHGDLDNTLVNPTADIDVHMGKHNFLCIDCHKTSDHDISGNGYSVNINHEGGVGCTGCHDDTPHRDSRINAHLDDLACQTCHIPSFAKRAPTKLFWDWSKAGNKNRKEDLHTYLRKKGEFVYGENVKPKYAWFNQTSQRYLVGDQVNQAGVTSINKPNGNIHDRNAKIWPFKIHRAYQPYDTVYNYLIQPTTSGEGGYWREYNWDKALRLGAQATGLKYSGKYGFTQTDMHWPLNHMVSPKEKVLQCCDCHGGNQMDWKSLGYQQDPASIGGRDELFPIEDNSDYLQKEALEK